MKKMSNEEFQQQYKFPHCDSRVLHAPGECQYCDHYPNRQQERVDQKINFTGHTDPEKQPCPADAARGVAQAHRWGGNAPKPTLCKFCGHPQTAHQMDESCIFSPGSKWTPRTPEEEDAETKAYYDAIVQDVLKKRGA